VSIIIAPHLKIITMNNNATPVESLFQKAEDYGRTTIELFKLNAIDKSANIFSSLAAQLTIIIIATLFILIVSIGVAFWIGDLLGKTYYGFFVVAGVYALVGLLLYIFRRQWIKEPVNNSIISHLQQ